MKTQTTFTIGTMVLGVLSLAALLLAHLALTDIYHGEADVTLEWNIVRITALVIWVFTFAALVMLGRLLVKRHP